MDSIYIEGRLDPNRNSLECSLPGAVVIFVSHYCQQRDINIHIVHTQETNNYNFSFPYEALVECIQITSTAQTVDHRVKQCALPVAILHGGLVVTSGLCSVLRHIVKVSHSDNPPKDFISLLGLKALCLKSCAEVSAWTKFCEIEIIEAAERLCQEAAHCQNDVTLSSLPEELLRFESHLKEPPIIPNVGKRKRELAKAVGHKNNDPSTNQKVQKLLQHNYAEGIDFTITDLVLYFCIHSLVIKLKATRKLLLTLTPKVYEWYVRVGTMEDVRKAVYKLGMSETMVIEPQRNLTDDMDDGKDTSSKTLMVGQTKRSVNEKRHGKKKFKASANEIIRVLEQVESLQLQVPVSVHPHDGEMQLSWDSFPSAVHPQEGELPSDRVQRKCQQLESLATVIQGIAKPGDTIVDFCSGGGHLGILIAHLLPSCHVTLVENKEESIMRAVTRVQSLAMTNVSIYQSNLDYFTGKFEIGVCLHACGVATDLVLQRCLDNLAAFVICPCCYGSIKRTHTVDYPRSVAYRERGIGYDSYLVIGHGGDQTQVSTPAAVHGKMCMVAIDSDRATLAQEHGYEVTLCSLQPETCSPKNNILIGTKAN